MAFERTRTTLRARRNTKTAAVLQKAFNVVPPRHHGRFVEAMSVPAVFGRHPNLEDELNAGVMAESILLMIDLSPFSSAVAEFDPPEIRELLNLYYTEMGPIIEDGYGVVEKYIGDAIIAVFGAPFNGRTSTLKSDLLATYQTAKRLISEVESLFGDDLVAKVAIAFGKCFLGYVGPESHCELTVVGNPLTHLFRLEEHAKKGGVIIPEWIYKQFKDEINFVGPGEPAKFTVMNPRTLPLKGVGNLEVRDIVQSKYA